MRESVFRSLAPVRRRQQTLFLLRAAALGLLVGAVVALALAAARVGLAADIARWTALAAPAVGLALGALVGLCLRRSWHDAAAAVDSHYGLKDRSTTALDFVSHPKAGELRELAVADAVDHLSRVQPREVVPLRRPKSLAYAGAASLAAAALMLWPSSRNLDAATPETPQHIVAEAERLQEALQDLEEVAKEEGNEELKKLVEQLKKKAEEMKQPGIDEREALAKLSEMQSAIQAQQAEYNAAVIDGQLASLGSALAAAQAFEGAGKALQEAKLEKAAKELEALDDQPKLDRKEAKAVEEKLKQVAKEMGEAGLGQMSNAVSDLAENLKSGKGKVGKASKLLAKEVNKQARRKKLNDLLNAKLDELKECKCNCQSNSLVRGKKPQKSNSPSNNYGLSTSGNVQGEKTKMLSQRNQVDLTGTPGEGPSETETVTSPEARQQASRGLKENYQKYRKMSEAVLDSEPIPLGHRQMIRKYFELIRPQNGDLSDRPEKSDAK